MSERRRETLLRRAALAVFALVIVAFGIAMSGTAAQGTTDARVSASGKWTCSMCPQFILPEPGKCPKCFMDLIPLEEGAGGGSRLELHLSHDAATLAGITTEIVEASQPADAGDAGEAPPLSVPVSAVLTNRGRSVVFVEAVEDDHLVYTIREIELSGRNGNRVFVVSGLDEGEAVAASGVFRIDSAMQILGKVSLANLPEGKLSADESADLPPYQPAERSRTDIRLVMPDVDAWFGRYEAVRAALAKDAPGEAERPARELAALLSTSGLASGAEMKGVVSRLAASSRTLSHAADLPAKRAAFEKLTADMVLFARRYGTPDAGLNLVFCPMAFGGSGAYWLQPGAVVDNPYHGLEMPTCGWLVDAIRPFARGDAGRPPIKQE